MIGLCCAIVYNLSLLLLSLFLLKKKLFYWLLTYHVVNPVTSIGWRQATMAEDFREFEVILRCIKMKLTCMP